MSEAYAWLRLAAARKVRQTGTDETKLEGMSTLNEFASVPNQLDPNKTDFLHLGAAKILVDGTAEGVRAHVETRWKRGQFQVLFMRAHLANLGYDPDKYIPMVDGGVKLHKTRAVIHDT